MVTKYAAFAFSMHICMWDGRALGGSYFIGNRIGMKLDLMTMVALS
jgi:hypothetical protein